MDLADLKKRYAVLVQQHQLPAFEALSEYFEIDKIEREPLFLLRDVRKIMIEKILEFTRLVEMLSNPSNAPSLFLHFIKQVSAEDRSLLDRTYKQFVGVELESLACDIRYNGEKESALIKEAFSLWVSLQGDLGTIIAFMKRNFHQTSTRREKSYI